MGLEYYIIDVETTGLKAGYHEIFQISLIRYADQKQVSFDIAVEHPERANQDALDITGRTMKDIVVGDIKENVVNDIEKFLSDDGKSHIHRCMVAHNASFDRRFSHALWESVGKEFPANYWLCTMAATKSFIKKIGAPKPASFNLNASLRLAGLEPKDGAHDAIVDTQNTYSLFNELMNKKIDHLALIKAFPHSTKKDSYNEQEYY